MSVIAGTSTQSGNHLGDLVDFNRSLLPVYSSLTMVTIAFFGEPIS